MKVLVAGATGAIGQPIVARLRDRRHDVVALTRRPALPPELEAAGATHAQGDLLDAAAIDRIVARELPDAIIAQPTSLPKRLNPRRLRKVYEANNRVRFEGTANLLRAAKRNSVRRFVAQSSAFWYKPTPGQIKTEADPFWLDAPEPLGEAVRTMKKTEDVVLAETQPEPVLLRYAGYYGPGTWFSRHGDVGQRIAKRMYPIVGDGSSFVSFVHIQDAANATVAALEGHATGAFNVADDEPAPTTEWLPVFAQALGAPPPRRVRPWLARLAIGTPFTTYILNTRGASNALFKAAFPWEPAYPSWRQGFRENLG